MRVLVISGPNMNLLGEREGGYYGSWTLGELQDALRKKGQSLDMDVYFFQSNHEGELVERIQQARDYDYLVVNAAAYTHTSVAIRDALLALGKPFIEVHMSNVFAREPFRHRSFLSDIARGVIVGLGPASYLLALEALAFLEEYGSGSGGD